MPIALVFQIPAHIPVLVLANHRDMGSHRVIDLDELQALVESIDRSDIMLTAKVF